MRRKIIVGNWKMGSDSDHCTVFLSQFTQVWQGVHLTEVCICPAFPYLERVANAIEHSNIALGAQTLDVSEGSTLTGGVNATMLADLGCRYVIIGHSESRRQFSLSYSDIAKKHDAALKQGLIPIICLGESLAEYKTGKTFDVIGRQLLKVVGICGLGGVAKGIIAYQPGWASLSDISPTPEHIQEVHSYIREVMGPEGDQVRIIYGGDILEHNALDLMNKKDIDGLLVGEASLNIGCFVDICRAADIN